MAYKEIKKEGNRYIAGRYEYVCDSISDLSTILTDHDTLSIGAIARVISSGDKYILNSAGSWIKQPSGSGGGGGGGGGNSLPITGGTMSGDINMGSHTISGLADAEDDDEAVSLGLVTDLINTSMESVQDMISSTAIRDVWVGTQAQYESLTPSATTLYLIEEEGT